MSAGESEIWVVVSQNDKDDPRFGKDEGGPLVHETYTRGATKQEAQRRAGQMERYGACRIARLVFDDQVEAGS